MKTKAVAFEGYTGNKTWKVTHPKRKKSVTVKAPDETCAIYAAANEFGEKWTAVNYYAFASASKM